MWKAWTVACQYLFIDRSKVGEMNHLAKYLNVCTMRLTRACRLLGPALPKFWVSILLDGTQWVQIIMNTIMDGCRDWLDNPWKWESTDRPQLLVLKARWLLIDLVTVYHNLCSGCSDRQNTELHCQCPILRMSIIRASQIAGFASCVM